MSTPSFAPKSIAGRSLDQAGAAEPSVLRRASMIVSLTVVLLYIPMVLRWLVEISHGLVLVAGVIAALRIQAGLEVRKNDRLAADALGIANDTAHRKQLKASYLTGVGWRYQRGDSLAAFEDRHALVRDSDKKVIVVPASLTDEQAKERLRDA